MQQQLPVNDAQRVNNTTLYTLFVRIALVANTKLPIHKQMQAANFVPPGKNLLQVQLIVKFARTASFKHKIHYPILNV